MTRFGDSFLWGGIAAYFILWAVTDLLLKRQVTTELFLIDGWAMLALLEINVLYGIGRFSHGLAVIFVVVTEVAVLISYTIRYGKWRLNTR